MTRYDAAAELAGLKDFQRATVEHIAQRFFVDAVPTRRFLVADETGLGKSVVARGVVAKTLQHLQDDDTVDRIDIVYICSNADIARQNIDRLQVAGARATHLSTRLTMLARHTAALAAVDRTQTGKPVNLVAFTPGTSFEQGWSTGLAQERALIYLLLEQELGLTGWDARSALTALRATTRTFGRFRQVVEGLRAELGDGPDPVIAESFAAAIRGSGAAGDATTLFMDVGRRRELPADLHQRSVELIRVMRGHLARASIDSLEPDLVILDEFQRFRNLLSIDAHTESAELAQALFGYGAAKVLLLSATPYKPFTLDQEAAATGESHHEDLFETLRFLRDDEHWLGDVRQALATYRVALASASGAADAANRVRELLLPVMTRSERPPLRTGEMVVERQNDLTDVGVDDVLGYVALRSLADELGGIATLEYWKSAPYFLNFADGYKLGDKLKAAVKDGPSAAVRDLVSSTQQIDADAVRAFRPIDLGNARLRRLAADTVDQGWEKLLCCRRRCRTSLCERRSSSTRRRASPSGWCSRPGLRRPPPSLGSSATRQTASCPPKRCERTPVRHGPRSRVGWTTGSRTSGPPP